MTIYRSSNKEDFIEEIIHFALINFAIDFSKLKIILPSGLLCKVMQRTLLKQLGTSILPTIIPLEELIAEGEEIFKIPSEQIGSMSRLEEKITLADTIASYEPLNYDISQSMRLAPSLANLFFDFEANNVDLEKLKDLPVLDQPEHWHAIYDFLSYAFNEWQIKIAASGKMTRAAHQRLIFNAEIQRLKNDPNNNLLIAGVSGNDSMSLEFISNVSALDNGHLILAPFTEISVKDKFLPEDALYKISRLLKNLTCPADSLKLLGKQKTSILDNLLKNSDNISLFQHIDYIEFDNIFYEAEYIALKCQAAIKQNSAVQIAFITHNQQSKEQYAIFLDKYQLRYHDLFGEDVLKQNLISLILLVAENLCCKFDNKKFFALLAHPLVNSEITQKLKHLIRKENRLVGKLDSIGELIESNGDAELQLYYTDIQKAIGSRYGKNSFSDLLKQTIKGAERLVPEIWQKYSVISSSLAEIAQVNWSYLLPDVDVFPELLQQILDGGRVSSGKLGANITLCRPNDSALINYDLVIISDLNESIYPGKNFNSPWLNKKMQEELELNSKQSNLGAELYDFYLNLHNSNILLTRAKKHGSNSQMLPSQFILHLEHLLGEKMHKRNAIPSQQVISESASTEEASSLIFPRQISATDIETLIRAPYNFYAKKILNLRKVEEIDDRPNLAEFGNFFHLVVEQYTKQYNSFHTERELILVNTAKEILATTQIPEYNKKSWLIKIGAIAESFIEFDEERRKNAIYVHSEIKGKLELEIAGQKVRLIAIADRIEIDQNGIATILDYKTGAEPSKKDVSSGLAPQLIIEAIILSEGGFELKSRIPEKIIYVKINSSAPYFKLVEIELTREDIYKHKQGLISLLEHYMSKKNFLLAPNLMKYDDYTHLARRA